MLQVKVEMGFQIQVRTNYFIGIQRLRLNLFDVYGEILISLPEFEAASFRRTKVRKPEFRS